MIILKLLDTEDNILWKNTYEASKSSTEWTKESINIKDYPKENKSDIAKFLVMLLADAVLITGVSLTISISGDQNK